MTHSQTPAVAGWQLIPGQSLPAWRIVAQNDATDSGNPMHDDARARQLGFAGGLVPGVTLYGYLTRPFVALFGQSFLDGASFEVRFRRPVYEGEAVTTEVTVRAVEDDGCTFEFALRNPAGESCVVGTARHPALPATPPPKPATVPLPVARRPATPEELRANPQLGTLHETFTAAQSAHFVAGMGDDLAIYRAVVHPSWLLRQANLVVDRNLAVGPWIHVASEIRHFGVIALGELFTVHARITAFDERKGNDYADIDVVYMTDRPVMHVLHKAIYRMGAAG